MKSGDGEKQAEMTFRQSSMSIPSNNGKEGAIKKGISRPVEVVVRPAGLGLGYGSFKEATQLKVNRQIEAEVRGLDPSKVESSKMESEKKKNSKEDGVFDGVPKSLLPSTQSLLNQSADRWRKGKANKKTKRKIVMYQDILNESSSDGPEKMKIIDMRGPSAVAAPMVDHEPKSASTTQSHSSSPADVPLGEELLHNVTLLLNTHESQLRTSSYMVKSTQRKVESLEAEGTEMAQRREVITGRMNKIQLALNAIDEAEKLVEKISSMDIALPDTLQIAMCSTAKLIAKLYGNFSREERISLKFDAMLIPSIVKPIMNIFTSVLEPLRMDLSWVTHLSATGISELCNAVGSDDEAYALREIIFMTSIVPWIKDSLNSSRWDPVMNAEVGLGLYDALLTSVHNFSLNDELNSHSEEDDILEEVINDSIIQNAIYPKLLRAVSHWKPQSGNKKPLINPMHLWIMPWLPHLNNESMLGTLLVDIRRKLKSTLSFLSKSQSDDMAFVRSCIHTLLPWRNLYPEHALFDLTSDSVTPRFARAMARINIVMSTMEQDWEQIHVLFEYFEQGLMSVDDFLCLIDGEVLPVWSTALYSTLKQDSSHVDIAKFFYVSWKKKLFEQVAQTPTKSSNPQIILQSDSIVCRYFYAGLEMMRAAFESNEEVLQSLEPPNPADCNYRISLMLRGKDKKLHHEPSSVQVKVRVHRARDGGNIASFQEVVSVS